MPGADMVDRLDIIGGRYHHEGPYDAALLARNTSHESSPLAAVSDSIKETLKATPSENINNSVKAHHPLDGTAVVPPGEADRYGRTFQYKEDGNMMVDNDPSGGGYRRWPGVVSPLHFRIVPICSQSNNSLRNIKMMTSMAKASHSIPLNRRSRTTRSPMRPVRNMALSSLPTPPKVREHRPLLWIPEIQSTLSEAQVEWWIRNTTLVSGTAIQRLVKVRVSGSGLGV